MAEMPETRESLLAKVRDPGDQHAWEEFVSIYRPAIYRLARRRGMQDADAEDLTQHVLLNVSNAIGAWRRDPVRGSFRSWLTTVCRNAIINAMTRGRKHAARGGSDLFEPAARSAGDDLDQLIEEEHRRAVFRSAAATIQREFHESTWLAFWLTTARGFSVEDAAVELGKSPGAVYAARSRVMRRLTERIQQIDTRPEFGGGTHVG